jgi:hypothetical protein
VLRLAVVFLVACGGSRLRPPEPPPPEALAGTWAVSDGSDVLMRIFLESGPGAPPRIEAWAAAAKVAFEVSEVSWDGHRLKATFRYPPTGVVTRSDLELVTRSRLEGKVSGTYVGNETWLRVE